MLEPQAAHSEKVVVQLEVIQGQVWLLEANRSSLVELPVEGKPWEQLESAVVAECGFQPLPFLRRHQGRLRYHSDPYSQIGLLPCRQHDSQALRLPPAALLLYAGSLQTDPQGLLLSEHS